LNFDISFWGGVEYRVLLSRQIVVGPGKQLRFLDGPPLSDEDAAIFGGLEKLKVRIDIHFHFLKNLNLYQASVFVHHWDENGKKKFKFASKKIELDLANGTWVGPKRFFFSNKITSHSLSHSQ
jgi:hypothetical protein